MTPTAHSWWECRPALLITGETEDTADAVGQSAVDRVWAKMADADRHRFHKFTCEADRCERTLDVIYEMRAALRREGVD